MDMPGDDEPKLDDIADFIFKFLPDPAEPRNSQIITAKGKVKRLEQLIKEPHNFGIALEFLSGPGFVYGDKLRLIDDIIQPLPKRKPKFPLYDEW
jgi:hypothetical protein